MKRSTLIIGLVAIGVGLWLASHVVDTHPLFARAMMVAGLVFFAFAARPSRG